MKRKLAVLLTAATVFSAILPTTCMAAEKKADIPEGTTISFWHAMGGVNGEALDYLVNKFNEENEYGIKPKTGVVTELLSVYKLKEASSFRAR